MNCILTINCTKFLSPDTVTAAKVADLLGKMKPVDSKYWHTDFNAKNYDSGNAFFFEGGKHHHVSIEQINPAAVLEDESAADEFIGFVTSTDTTPQIPQAATAPKGGAK